MHRNVADITRMYKLWYYAAAMHYQAFIARGTLSASSFLSGTSPGVLNRSTTMTSGTARRGYHSFSSFCFSKLLTVTALKTSRTSRRIDITVKMTPACLEPKDSWGSERAWARSKESRSILIERNRWTAEELTLSLFQCQNYSLKGLQSR